MQQELSFCFEMLLVIVMEKDSVQSYLLLPFGVFLLGISGLRLSAGLYVSSDLCIGPLHLSY